MFCSRRDVGALSFYTMGAMFVLYRDHSEGFGWTKAEATTLYSNYSMLVYASPLIGGISRAPA